MGATGARLEFVGIKVYDIPEGKLSRLMPGKTTEGFILLCRFTGLVTLSVLATVIAIGDPRCSASSDKLLAVDTANDNIDNKMVLEPNVSLHKQVVKDYDVKECISIEDIENLKVPLFFFKIM